MMTKTILSFIFAIMISCSHKYFQEINRDQPEVELVHFPICIDYFWSQQLLNQIDAKKVSRIPIKSVLEKYKIGNKACFVVHDSTKLNFYDVGNIQLSTSNGAYVQFIALVDDVSIELFLCLFNHNTLTGFQGVSHFFMDHKNSQVSIMKSFKEIYRFQANSNFPFDVLRITSSDSDFLLINETIPETDENRNLVTSIMESSSYLAFEGKIILDSLFYFRTDGFLLPVTTNLCTTHFRSEKIVSANSNLIGIYTVKSRNKVSLVKTRLTFNENTCDETIVIVKDTNDRKVARHCIGRICQSNYNDVIFFRDSILHIITQNQVLKIR